MADTGSAKSRSRFHAAMGSDHGGSSYIRNAEREGGKGFPDITEAARAKILASETAISVTNDALQMFGAAGYSRNLPLERMVRDARMFTIGGGTAQILRTVVASQVLGRKLPQTRDGYVKKEKPKNKN